MTFKQLNNLPEAQNVQLLFGTIRAMHSMFLSDEFLDDLAHENSIKIMNEKQLQQQQLKWKSLAFSIPVEFQTKYDKQRQINIKQQKHHKAISLSGFSMREMLEQVKI